MRQINLIAPCGMNCAVCMMHLREQNPCQCCRASDEGKPITRTKCKIKTCNQLRGSYCFDCEDFPCKKLNHLDKRYRSKYQISVIENLQNIRQYGLHSFLKSEEAKWTCKHCKGLVYLHTKSCITCATKT
jgi:hypothetical protein